MERALPVADQEPNAGTTTMTSRLTCCLYPTPALRKAERTANAIEQRFRVVRRRTRPMSVIQDHTSLESILFAVFARENQAQDFSTHFLLAQPPWRCPDARSAAGCLLRVKTAHATI